MVFHFPGATFRASDKYLTGETLQNIKHIIKQVKGMLTEIAVVDYQKTA